MMSRIYSRNRGFPGKRTGFEVKPGFSINDIKNRHGC